MIKIIAFLVACLLFFITVRLFFNVVHDVKAKIKSKKVKNNNENQNQSN